MVSAKFNKLYKCSGLFEVDNKHFPYESTAAYGSDKEKFIEQNITIVVFITYYRIRYSFGIVRSKMAPNFDLLPILSKNKKRGSQINCN